LNFDTPEHPTLLNTPETRGALLNAVCQIARAAGAVIMDIYQQDFAVRGKSDQSPVTEADERAEQLILAALDALTPGVPVVAEERVAAGVVPTMGERFWLVDPLDGTKEFIKRNGEFTVNIALVEHGVPSLGVVVAPALGAAGRLFYGAQTLGAWVDEGQGPQPIQCREPPDSGLRVVASRSHGDPAELDAFLARFKIAETVSAGSSLKLCLVAGGQADLYPRLGPTMEWDIAAGHAILLAGGGWLGRLDNHQPLQYGKADLKNPPFLAAGRQPAADVGQP